MAKGVSHISMARIEMKNEHKTPVISSDKRTGWVEFGSNFPFYLIDLFNRSPKHSAIVTGKLLYILGKGWQGTGTMPAFIERANSDESLLQLSEKIILDYELFDGFYAEPIWNRIGTKILEWRHLPFQNVLSNYNNTKFGYSEKWVDSLTPREKDIIEFDAYKPGKTVYNKERRALYFFRAYRPGAKVYPLPNYMGGLAYIETDVEIANFNLNAIKNNLAVSKLVAFYNGIPSADERKAFETSFTANKTGTDNAGRILFSWSDSREKNVEVIDLSGDELDKRYNMLNETVQQEIFTAHKVTSPMLFGVKTSGQLGGRDELDIANMLFKANYIEPRKMAIVKAFQMMAEAMGYQGILSLTETQTVAGPTDVSAPVVGPDGSVPTTQVAVNDNIKNLTAKQHQQVLRIIRQYGKGLIDLSQASVLLQSGYGLTDEEVKTLLGGMAAEPTPSGYQRQTFSHDPKRLLSIFHKYGTPRDEVEVLEVVTDWRDSIVSINGLEGLEKVTLMEFAAKLSEVDSAVLDYLEKDSLTPKESIAKALEISIEDVSKSINRLTDKGFLKSTDNGFEITKTGTKELTSNLPETYDTYIVYHYDVAPGLGSLVIPGTRDFCRELIGMNKVFSRKDIEDISQEYGYSVWELRGGYYHNPKTGVTTDYCRHIWAQEIVTKKTS